ncbi:MAG: hypothetical protein HY420_02145, partial [Candidatus Kerfeldbacteria bacterium]|nr:hypothetical protein [Candidatus Kerfeldbacteria bacterium]
MMQRTLIGIAVTITLAAPFAALALGQLTSPIDVKNARRGQVIEERLILNNADAQAMELALSG